ncbi:ADP-dependent glucokinase/phosphofructokinase [Naumannella halotolerans]|uniref:ADP-dependent phosphofructokinase/glucokinase n=1 Tax=Naumannella halotolerans TaxID=993414 RepID=A0A4R7J979_9ACTN|nr:ADP-dependent glucokinase/phosphofructokinase [Naumannella halotolerans]TDT33885.1 ADP-dependent phosphofructokinase/glucokinase [Naumannella halotolerans]
MMILLGLGASIDWEVEWSARTVERRVHQLGVSAADLPYCGPIRTERDLLRTLLTLMAGGTGGERRVESAQLLFEFGDLFARTVSLGGTNVRAWKELAKLGVSSTLHIGGVGQGLVDLLPSSTDVLWSETGAGSYPHLIVQYPEGTTVTTVDGVAITTDAPNRAILVNDPASEQVQLAKELPAAMGRSDLVLLSGLNAMRDRRLVQIRLAELQSALGQLPDSALVFHEDAGYHDQGLAREIREFLLGRVDVFSMNEDEMVGHLGRDVDLASAEQVRAALADLGAMFPVPMLVVHTRHWAAARGEGAAGFGPALRWGSDLATTRYRVGDDWTAQDLATTGKLPLSDAGRTVRDGLSESPGLWTEPTRSVGGTGPRTTIGLGDAFVAGFLLGHGTDIALEVGV